MSHMGRLWRGRVLALVLLGACGTTPVARSQAAAAAPSTPEAKAEAAETAWLALVDAGKYGESWKATSAFFQSAVSQQTFQDGLGAVRTPLGKVGSRKLAGAQHATSLPGAPPGEYVVVSYATSFAQKSTAIETVTASHEKDGTWRVCGYYIK